MIIEFLLDGTGVFNNNCALIDRSTNFLASCGTSSATSDVTITPLSIGYSGQKEGPSFHGELIPISQEMWVVVVSQILI